MKTLAKIITMVVLMSAGTWMLPQKASAQMPGISFQVFYDQLTPYGAWVEDPNYGYVWVPDVAQGFMPYATGGHWIFTDYGWTWVSDYDWGWAPFHYGRWNLDPYYGWIWIPGNDWGPAWVSWRSYNDYYGWAPLGPGMTLAMTFRPGFFIPEDRWMFVRNRDFGRRDIGNFYLGRREGDFHNMIRNSRLIENTYIDNSRKVTYISGPDVREVRKYTGSEIKPLPIRENGQPGRTLVSKDKIEIYRPPVRTEGQNNGKPMPTRIIPKDNILPVADRKQGNLIKSTSTDNERKTKEVMPPAQKNNPPKYERNDKFNRNDNNTGVKTGKGSEGQTREIRQEDNQKKSLPPERINSQNENRSREQTVQPRTVTPDRGKPQVQQRKENQPTNKANPQKKTNDSHPVKTGKPDAGKKER